MNRSTRRPHRSCSADSTLITPPFPRLASPSRRSNRNFRLEVFDVIADLNQQLGAKTSITDGVFEHWLQHHYTLGEIPPGYFVATADISPDVLAVKDCQPVASIRYIIGTLR